MVTIKFKVNIKGEIEGNGNGKVKENHNGKG